MNHTKTALAIFLLFAFSLFTAAQNPTVDADFLPALSKSSASVLVDTLFQTDGKIITFGKFNVVNGIIRYSVARLNTNGTTDTTFNCTACTFIIVSAFVQPDGKILIGGRESVVAPFEKIIRVNPDGSLDTSFNFVHGTFTSTPIISGVQPDGKILVKQTGQGDRIYRLNPDGSLDSTFATIGGNVVNIEVLPDGRTFFYGDTQFGYLALLNPDGTKNTLFESPSLTYSAGSATPFINDIALQSDGKIIVSGRFTAINGINRDGIARLNTNQTVDMTFVPPSLGLGTFGNNRVFSVANNKVLVANPGITNPGRVFRLNNDGSLDNTFTIPSILNLFTINVDSLDRIYVFNGAYIRYNPDGTLDNTFNAVFEFPGAVTALALQPDGKILVGGSYQKANGINRKSVSRLNADGTTDTSFDTLEKIVDTPSIFDLGVQPDGKILVGGNFSYDGANKRLVRLNSNGSLDAAFNVTINGTSFFDTFVYDIALQSDGKILVGGSFTSVNGTARSGFARLNADGTLDSSFDVQLGSGTNVFSIIVQANGKIMIAGTFSGVNGFNRANLARLNSDGALDTSFNASVNSIGSLLLQPDGKYLALNFITIYRLNADGSPDASFQKPTLDSAGNFTDFALLNDGSIVISGTFTRVNGIVKNKLALLKPDGTLNSATFPKGTDSPPTVFVKQPDGKLLAGGAFTFIEEKPRTGFARLSFRPAFRAAKFDFDGDARSDISVFRPSTNVWYLLTGPNYQFSQRTYGNSGDIIVPADYDGDGKTDFAVFRPSSGNWIYIKSSDNSTQTFHWGQAGDIPLPSDVNGDGTDDFVIYRPSSNNWFRVTTTGVFTEIVFGTAGDKPLIGDFDGDGKADPAIYRPSTGTWWYAASGAGNAFRAVRWGIAEDIPVPADYDGDGQTDIAVFRPSNGAWYIINSNNSSYTLLGFGLTEDKPVAADYDGDGKADIAVFRPSTGVWYLLRSTSGFTGLQFGLAEDTPIPAAYNR